MPVPLPTPETVNLQPPDAEEAQELMDAVASAVGGGRGSLAPVQRSLLESLLSAMTGHRATVPDRPSMTPADIAQSMARRELSFRTRMVQVMLLCVLLLHPIPEDVAERIAATSAELGVEDGMVDVARELAAGSLALAKQDFVRNGYEGTWHGEESAAALHSARELQVWEFSVDDVELAAQWSSLETLPADSIGRKVWELYQARGFTFPGTPGSAPPLLAQHDWVHVLADYGTTVESEVEVFGFISTGERRHARLLVAGHGDRRSSRRAKCRTRPGSSKRRPGTSRAIPAWRHACRTPCGGARCATTARPAPTASTSSAWTGSPSRMCPVPSCAERFHLVAKAKEAVAAGSVGPWERGGISPFQMNAGQAMAAARGVPYDGHGASI